MEQSGKVFKIIDRTLKHEAEVPTDSCNQRPDKVEIPMDSWTRDRIKLKYPWIAATWDPDTAVTCNETGVYRMDKNKELLTCRIGCGACCIAPSISSPIPGMPDGKPAGVRCNQLSEDNRCMIFGLPSRPAVCSSLKPSEEMCGITDEEAMRYLTRLEKETSID